MLFIEFGSVLANISFFRAYSGFQKIKLGHHDYDDLRYRPVYDKRITLYVPVHNIVTIQPLYYYYFRCATTPREQFTSSLNAIAAAARTTGPAACCQINNRKCSRLGAERSGRYDRV
jgi:hypothetical protein